MQKGSEKIEQFYKFYHRETWGKPNMPGVNTRLKTKEILIWGCSWDCKKTYDKFGTLSQFSERYIFKLDRLRFITSFDGKKPTRGWVPNSWLITY